MKERDGVRELTNLALDGVGCVVHSILERVSDLADDARVGSVCVGGRHGD